MNIWNRLRMEDRTVLDPSPYWREERGYIDVQENPMEIVYKFHEQYGIAGWKDYFAVSKSRWRFKPYMPGVWYYTGLPRLRRGKDWLYTVRRFRSPDGFHIWGPIQRVGIKQCRKLFLHRREL